MNDEKMSYLADILLMFFQTDSNSSWRREVRRTARELERDTTSQARRI